MDILGIAPYNMKLKLQKGGQSMVELYVQELKKSIKDLEIDNELAKFVKAHLGKMLKAYSTILGLLLLPLSVCESYFEFSCWHDKENNII